MATDKKQRDEWRVLAENTDMVSAIGEYTPEEFVILLDDIDELEKKIRRMDVLFCVTLLRTLDTVNIEKVTKECNKLRDNKDEIDKLIASL